MPKGRSTTKVKERSVFSAIKSRVLLTRIYLIAAFSLSLSSIILAAIFLLLPTEAACTGTAISTIPITLTQSGTYCLTQDITNATGSITIEGSNITVDGRKPDDSSNFKITYATGGRVVDILATATKIRNNITVKNLDSNGSIQVFGDNADNFTLDNFKPGSNTTAPTPPNPIPGDLAIYSADFANIRESTLDSLVLWGQDATVYHNIIAGGGQHPVDVNGDHLVGSYGGCPDRGGNLFELNTITNTEPTADPGYTAVYVRCSTNNTFRNNTFEGRVDHNALFLRDAADYNLFENNTIKAVDGYRGAIFYGDGGADVPQPAHNTFSHNNILTGNTSAFLPSLTGGGNRFEYNLFVAGGPVTAFLRVDPDILDSDIYDHNTFYNTSTTGNGLRIGTSNTPAWRHETSFVFTNNIVSFAGDRLYDFEGLLNWAGVTADRNLFHDRSGSFSFGSYDFNGDSVLETVNDIATWRTKTGGKDANSQIGDPLFVNPSTNDFHLQSGSPATTLAVDGTYVGAFPTSTVCSWQCTAWSVCSGGTQTRTCTNPNNCATPSPATSNSCSTPSVNATTPGTVEIDAPTVNNLGFAWYITGDANRNAKVTVEYRTAGATTWKKGLDFLRVENILIETVQPGNLLAGSVFDLQPDTDYEVKLSLSDPDGGADVQTKTVRTRKIPVAAANARTRYVMPGTGGGTGTQADPFKGLAAADAAAVAGDLFLLQPGTYAGHTFTRDGTADAPIVYSGGTNRDTVKIDGGGTNGDLITLTNRKNLMFEKLTIRNVKRAIYGKDTDGITIRYVTFRDQILGSSGDASRAIYLADASKNGYICDNISYGPETERDRASNMNASYGFHVSGTGHVVCHNDVRNWWDDFGFECRTANLCSSIDVHNNLAQYASDDLIEADAGLRNIRVYRNRIMNASGRGISVQPAYGGPIYLMRNEIYNVNGSPFKFHAENAGTSGPSGIIVMHNSTAVVNEAFKGGYWSNVIFRNNLLYGTFSYSMDTVGKLVDFDYDSWSKKQTPVFKIGPAIGQEVRYNTINDFCDVPSQTTDYCAATGNERYAKIIDRTEWVNVPEPTGTVDVSQTGWDMTLQNGAGSIDSGVLLPNINDAFAGLAPDRGALEKGKPLPIYGPRPTLGPDTVMPTINVTAPSNGTTVTGQVTISGTATDNVGVTRVELYRNATLLSQFTTSQFSYVWDTTKELTGAVELQAKAYDAAGNVGVSAVVTVTIADQKSPTVSLLTPSPGATITGSTLLYAVASDDVEVSAVTFKLDGRAMTPQPAPHTSYIVWNSTTTTNGAHIVTVSVGDAAGNQTTSAPLPLTVSNITSISCGAPCAGTSPGAASPPGRILGPACSTPNRLAATSNNNAIENIALSSGVVQSGSPVTATITYNCSSDNPSKDSIALWYYNGSWQKVKYWPAVLTDCDFNYINDIDGTLVTSFTPGNGTSTTQYVRAIISSGTPTADSASCPSIRFGNIDDLQFTVTAGGGGGKQVLPP